MPMHGYFFNAYCIRAQIRMHANYRGVDTLGPQVWDDCYTAIVWNNDLNGARKVFESCLFYQPPDQNPIDTRIEKMVSAPILDQVLTEKGNVPVEWPQLADQILAELEALPAPDDFEQGYWLDVNEALPVATASRDIETLRQKLPEDIRSGLNWSPDKQFSCLICALKMPPAVIYDPATGLPVETKKEEEVSDDEFDPESAASLLNLTPRTIPEPAAVAIVRARNTAVALHLWRKHAASLKLVENPVTLNPMPNIYNKSFE